MDFKVTCRDCTAKRVEMTELRKGEWTVEEDSKLIDCVSIHGPAQWSYLAHSAGLKRTGKSCRLRWLNYLRPGVKRGNFTLEEQILILELQSRWGNRWSRIAQGLPGRTDNEIKNYWRTRVQKLANQLNCGVNSTQFRDTLHHIWLPRLREQAQATAGSAQSTMVQPINTTPTDHIAWNNTITGYQLSDSYCTNYSESPEEANQVSPASDLSAYGDHQGDVLLSSGNWWERIQEEGPITHTDQVGVSGYYSEQEEGYWCHVFEECNRWFGGGGGGGGDSFDHLNDDVNWLIMTY